MGTDFTSGSGQAKADKGLRLSPSREAAYLLAVYRQSQEAARPQRTSTTQSDAASRSVRRRLSAIRSKIMAGGRLTAEEKQFLRKYAPELLSRYMALEQQQKAAKERQRQQEINKRLEKERRQAVKKRLEKERQQERKARLEKERHREEEETARIRAYAKAASLSGKMGPGDPSYYPILSAPSELSLAAAMTEPSVRPKPLSPVALAADGRQPVNHTWAGERASAAAGNEARARRAQTAAWQNRKEKQETEMEWIGKEKQKLEELQEAAEAQAAETRSFQGRAAYKASSEQPVRTAVDPDKKTCNRKA